MNPPIVSSEAEVLTSDIDILAINPAELHAADAADEQVMADVIEHHTPRTPSYETGLNFVNSELADRAKAVYNAAESAGMEQFLTEKGTTHIPILRGYTVMVDGVECDIAMVAATLTEGANHGEMSSMLYLRDQVQAISAMMELWLQDPDTYAAQGKIGKELLMSALHLMSTPAQLERFQKVIQMGADSGQEDWPHISLWFNDLDGVGPNKWRNKQDSFQMLAYTALDAIDRGFLKPDELADGHKKFLTSIVPLLESVGFPNYESSGSWEEITAMRSSVISVETAMLHKMKALVDSDLAMSFLAEEYDGDFSESLEDMIHAGLYKLGRNLPNESPDQPGTIKYREADAALAYVLMYDVHHLLADYEVPMAINDDDPMTAAEIECKVLEQLDTLLNAKTHGMDRYKGDSYLCSPTNRAQKIIKAIKHKVLKDSMSNDGEIDLDEKQRLRDELTPAGKEASWNHPLCQLLSFAAKNMISAVHKGDEALANQYRKLSTDCLNAALSTVTGEGQWHLALDENGEYQVVPVPANKIPECWLTIMLPNGKEIHVASPHTPLNWASAELMRGIGLFRIATELYEKRSRS